MGIALRFRVLGPLLVSTGGDLPVSMRGQRMRSLLVALLLRANEPVSVDRLVTVMWGDSPPKSYLANLHTYVNRLRQRLAGVPIMRDADGYRIILRTQDLDLLVYRAEVEAARHAVRAGAHAVAGEHFARALAQWRGEPLAGVDSTPFDADVRQLEVEKLTVTEEWVAAELDAGHAGHLIEDLTALVERYPLQERFSAQLMIALYHAGRPADALEVYRQARTVLRDQVGIEPGEELRRTHQAVLAQRLPHRPAAAAVVFPIRQLPPDTADFTGRAEAIEQLTGLLTASDAELPVVVICGEPGAGKSTLAVRVVHRLADRFPDGQLFVPLAGSSGEPRDTGELLADLLRSLSVVGPAIPDDVAARAATYRARLAGRRVLVVLDDAAELAQVRALLPGSPGCAALITSRRRLSGLAGATQLPLGRLTDSEALALLGTVAGRERVAGQPADADRIAGSCGNLPLALRIAGTRLAIRPNLPLRSLADRLEDTRQRLDELVVGDLGVRASLALSYQALHPTAQRAYRLLGLYRTIDVPPWSIAALLGIPDAENVIEELVEASLLQPVGTDRTGQPRYRMHDLVWLHARELWSTVESETERAATSRRLLTAALGLTDIAARAIPRTFLMCRLVDRMPAPSLVDGLAADAEAWFASERVNLVSSIRPMCRVGWIDEAVLLAERFSVYLWKHGYWQDLRTVYDALGEGARMAGDGHVAARADTVFATLSFLRGDFAAAEAKLRRSLAVFRRSADEHATACVLTSLADCLNMLGEPQEALSLAGQAFELFDAADDLFGAASARLAEIDALNRLGRVSESLTLGRTALTLADQSEEPWLIGKALRSLGWSRLLIADLSDAGRALEEALALLRPLGDRSQSAHALHVLGLVRGAQGDRATAVRLFEQSKVLAEALDERPMVVFNTRATAATWIADGRTTQADTALRHCLRQFHAMGSTTAQATTWGLIAAANDANDDERAAASARQEAQRLGISEDADSAAVLRLLLTIALADQRRTEDDHDG